MEIISELLRTDDPVLRAELQKLQSLIKYESYEKDFEALTEDLDLEIFNRKELPVPYVVVSQLIISSYLNERAIAPLMWLCKEQRWPVGEHVHAFLELLQFEQRFDQADEIWQAILANSTQASQETRQYLHRIDPANDQTLRVYVQHAVEANEALIAALCAYRAYLMKRNRAQEIGELEKRISALRSANR